MAYENDTFSTGNNCGNGGSWHCAYQSAAFSSVSGWKDYAQAYSVSGKSAALRGFWAAGDLLSEKCERFIRKSRFAGTALHCFGSGTSSVETPDASVHCRRNHLLYGAGPDDFLREAKAAAEKERTAEEERRCQSNSGPAFFKVDAGKANV